MRILGLDIGDVRIGAAISDPGQKTANPLEVVDARDTAKAVGRIVALVAEYEAEAVVYGLPLTLSGDAGPQCDRVLSFAAELKKRIAVPLIAKDERLSTSEGEKILIGRGVKRERRKQIIDMLAASIILQSYLDGENAKK